jgi:glycosyltransferase involved in cell wall biosynthesis
MRKWDLAKNQGVHRFITLSQAVQKRIKEWYRRESDIIYPPVDTKRFIPGGNQGDYFLIVSRLRGYKHIDLAIKACNERSLPLKIIGDGDSMISLKRIAGSTVEFLGHRNDGYVTKYMQNCRAFIFPGEEDFGIAPLEAQACGRPVIAYKAGGSLDTIIEGKTGLFFNEQTVGSLLDCLDQFAYLSFDLNACRRNALRFSENIFQSEIKRYIEISLDDFRIKSTSL